MIRDGRGWFFLSRAAARVYFPYISDRTMRTIIDKLIKGGYVIKGDYSDKLVNKSTWYSLTEKAISLFEDGRSPLVKTTNGMDEMTNDIENRKESNRYKKESLHERKESDGGDGTLFGGGEEANCLEKPKATSQTTTKNNEANRPAATLEEREARFSEECRAFTAEFGARLVEDFILYWTEPTKGKTRMKFEQQPTWDTHRRMLTWKRNNFNKYDRIEAQPREEHYLTAEEIDRVMNWRRDD